MNEKELGAVVFAILNRRKTTKKGEEGMVFGFRQVAHLFSLKKLKNGFQLTSPLRTLEL